MFYSRSAEAIVAKDFDDMVMPSERRAISEFAERMVAVVMIGIVRDDGDE